VRAASGGVSAGYGTFKKDLAEVVADTFAQVRERSSFGSVA
jgi:hypothetical protein